MKLVLLFGIQFGVQNRREFDGHRSAEVGEDFKRCSEMSEQVDSLSGLSIDCHQIWVGSANSDIEVSFDHRVNN